MTYTQKLAHCAGCYCDVYNHGCGGVKQCWHLRDAKLILRKEISIHQVPPFMQKARRFLSCYHRPQYQYCDPNRIN